MLTQHAPRLVFAAGRSLAQALLAGLVAAAAHAGDGGSTGVAAAASAAAPVASPAALAQAATPPPAAASPPAAPAPVAAPMPRGRPRVGLALSGGGARGFSHVGVLRVLEELRVPVDCIAGTSAGSAVGAAYAAGLSPDEIERRLRAVDWANVFDDLPPRSAMNFRAKERERDMLLGATIGVDAKGLKVPEGLVAGQKIELVLHELIGVSEELDSFDRLAVPFRAMATDIGKGEPVEQGSGSLVRAVRASMSLPGILAPVKEKGRLMVDGGLMRNLPVDIVRGMCADVVIAVNIGSPIMKEDELTSLFGITAQMVNVLIEQNVRQSLREIGPSDFLIVPDLGNISSSDFTDGLRGIVPGEKATRAMAEELRRLSVPEADYAAWQKERQQWAAAEARTKRLTGVAVTPTRYVNPAVIEANVANERAGEPFDAQGLRPDLDRLMATGDFFRVGYRLLPEVGGYRLQVEPVERSYGPGYLRFGLGATAQSGGESWANVLFQYRQTWVNSLGAEWLSTVQFGRTSVLATELYQPLSVGGRWYVLPNLSWVRRPIDIYFEGQRIGQTGIKTTEASLSLGWQAPIGDFRGTVSYGYRDAIWEFGTPLLPDYSGKFAAAALTFDVDQLDAALFPRKGYALSLRGQAARDVLGGTEDWTRLVMLGRAAYSIGRHTFEAGLRLGDSPGGRLPIWEAFSLGGFMNLSGYPLDRFIGSRLEYGRLSYYNELMPLPPPFGSGLYAGLMLEGGRVTEPSIPGSATSWQPAIGAFVGAKTGLGPIFLGFGVGRDGNSAAYVFLGMPR